MKKETAMTLSPTAQAVRDAAFEPWQSTDTPESIAAAALRAAADQVAPIEYETIQGCWYEKENSVREQLIAIAEELEAQ